MVQTTKKALAMSLKKLLAVKPLDKITVVDIAEDCEVNRQTFYYHFKDIYDLVEWTLITEAAQALEGKKTYDTWQQGFLQIFEWVLENKNFVRNAYRSISREVVERILYEVTYQLLIGVIEEKAAGIAIREDDKTFIANFYNYAFVGIMLEWIRTGMKEEPASIINKLSILIHGDITRGLKKMCTGYFF